MELLFFAAVGISLFELVKGAETGFDLVLLAITMSSLFLSWQRLGMGREGLVVGLVLFLVIKVVLVFVKPKKAC